MAFAKQYFSSYKSNNNLDYYLEIWVDGYTGGNPTEIKLGAGGPVISYDTDQEDRFSPILSSQCNLPFMVTGVGTEFFIRQLREVYKDKQVYLHLYRATSSTYSTVKPIWSGFLIMDLGSGEDVSFPYEQKLKFVDGLSLLKDIDFVDLSNSSTPAGSTIPLNERTQGNYDKLNMYYGPALYTFWIKEILKKVGAARSGVGGQGVSLNYGFTTAVNWYNGKMQNTNQASDPLGLTKCVVTMFHEKNDQEVFTPDNCYLVLKELLRHWGARITYWQHEFWIVQIPEYITTESGSLNNPTNINSRQYDLSGSLLGSQDYLGDEYYTRYEQTIQTDKVSKIVGTQYNYLPMINNVDAQFLSFASNNYYGGFPYGNNAENQEIYQGTIVDPSTADFLFLSIPLNWVWDMGSSALVNGHTNGWHCQVRFNFFASQLLNGTVTTFYLQYDSNGSYYWIPEIDWRPLGTESPNYKIKSRQLVESNYVGFEEQIPFVDSSGNPISMLGDWDFFLDIEKYGTSGNNPGSFICNFLGYGYQIRQFKPQTTIGSIPSPSGSGSTTSGTVSWSNTLEVPGTTNFSILPFSQLGFNAGTSTLDIRLITSSPFRGVLQALNTTQAATYGITLNTQIDNNTNTERYSFGTLLWGDAVQSFAIGALKVNTGTAFDKTDADGEWGRGILTGDKTFTELLIHEFLTGQLEVVISPSMRLVVGDSNKDVTISGVTRPRFVNPIGILRETRNGPDPVYFFRRGSFHSLYDEWDYEGYQILRDSVTSTTTTNDIGDLGGSQDSNPVSAAKLIGNVTDALSTNSTIASLRQTIPSIGANVAVNGNFNVATGWTLGTGWTIDTTASKAKFAATGSLSSLSQINLTEGTKYQVIFTIDITAGQLTVKAGSSGSSQVITVAGQYELYLLCEGSTSIQFQAGTTFTGSISQVSIADQKSLTSVPIESLGEAVFKTNDTFNIVNSINGEVIPLTVTSNQGATDTAISVTAVPLFDDIGIDSVLLINQDDLSAQYQNKTKGTVAGFDITATGIEKSSINITDWLNSDTMTGAAVTNVPTALSVKNYVDAQVGANDTLQEVTDNGNTTTNSINIGSSTAPAKKLTVTTSTTGDGILGITTDGEEWLQLQNDNSTTFPVATLRMYYGATSTVKITALSSEMKLGDIQNKMTFFTASAERMRLTSGGNVLIGSTSDNGQKLQVTGNAKINGLSNYSSDYNLLDLSSTKTSGSAVTNVKGINLNVGSNDHIAGYDITNLYGVYINNSTNGGSASVINNWYGVFVPPADSDRVLNRVSAYFGDSVLIGTTTDDGSSKLQIQAATSSKLYFKQFANQYQSGIQSENHFILASNETSGILENRSGSFQRWLVNASEKIRLTSTGLGIGTTSIANKLDVNGNISATNIRIGSNASGEGIIRYNPGAGNGIGLTTGALNSSSIGLFVSHSSNNRNIGINTFSPTEKLHVVGKGIFTDQVTIPATPIATTDAASKSYVDAQVGASDTLQEVLANGNTSGANDIIMNNNQEYKGTHTNGATYGLLTLTSGNQIKLGGYEYTTASVIIGGGVNARFNIGLTEKMRLTSTGLGIGTSSPSEKLEIFNGHVRLSDGYKIDWGGTNVRIDGDNSNGYFRVFTSGVEKMRLTSGGKLGINVSNPLRYLTVNSGAENFVAQFISTDDKASILLEDNDTLNYIHSQDSYLSIGSQSLLHVNNVNISAIGNTGFGTITPTEKIHVVGDALITGDSHADAFKPAATGEPIKFKNFGSTEVARITDSGQLLVGLTSSSNIVAFKDVADIEFDLNGSDAAMNFNSIWRTGVRASESSFRFAESNTSLGANVRMTIETGGQITLPSYGSGSFTGAETYFLAVTSGGDVVEADSSALPGGPYLPLAGGTLTGSLTGTTATFSGNVTVNNIIDSFGEILTFEANDLIAKHKHIHAEFGLWARSTGTNGPNSRLMGIDGSSSILGLYTNGSEKARITSGGNLLLGSTTDVGGNRKIQVTGGDFYTAEKSNTAGANVGYGGSSFQIRNGSTSQDLNFDLFNRTSLNWYTPFVIKNTGNVGIGTVTPAYKLDISGLSAVGARISSAGFANLDLVSSRTVGNLGGVRFKQDIDTYISGEVLGLHGGGFDFKTGNGTSGNPTIKMTLTSGGNLLLGTTVDNGDKLQIGVANSDPGFVTDPNVATTIASTTNGDEVALQLFVNDGTNNIRSKYFVDDTELLAGFDTTYSTGLNGFAFKMAGSEKMRLSTNGNLLLGTTSDDGVNKLQVNGRISTSNDGIIIGDSNRRLVNNSNNLELRTYASYSITVAPNNSESARFLANGNLLLGSTSDNSQKLQVTGNIRITGGFQASNTGGFLLADTGGSMRYGLKYGAAGAVGATNLMMLTNRSLSSATGGGEVAIAANASTTGVTETEVMRIKANSQSQVSIDGVLSLTSQNTPADPPNRASTIWLDSNFDLKIKITNNSGVTVTKTLAEYA
jgi:hypothetical protein